MGSSSSVSSRPPSEARTGHSFSGGPALLAGGGRFPAGSMVVAERTAPDHANSPTDSAEDPKSKVPSPQQGWTAPATQKPCPEDQPAVRRRLENPDVFSPRYNRSLYAIARSGRSGR